MSVYLKSLEISGFKSFGTRTYIEFSEGITGIVGPNGCGKSNVVESMKWVLGEQSAKSLRGEKMQDIIFAGNRHRSAGGMADVSLTFNNEHKWLPLEFPEVSIGRRVFRSGEGQYFVNGVRARLKDTTELFLDTGVGKDSYAIFEQGKIDRLLSESAEDRRVLFEDFAGISKFKFRKEEAEKKLSQARENLERLQETIDRLEKEIGVLELQANDAENYNTINGELREMEIKFEVVRIANMQREISRREEEIITLKNSLQPLSEQLSNLEEQMKISDEALGEKEVLFGKMNEKNIKLEKELSEAKIRYESAQKQHNDLKRRLDEHMIRSKQESERLEEWEDTLQEKQDALYEAQKKHKKAKIILDEAEAKQQNLKDQSFSLETELHSQSREMGFKETLNRDSLGQLRTKNSELQGHLYQHESSMLSFENELQQKKQALEQEKSQLSFLEEQLDQAQSIKDEILQEKNNILTEISQLEKEIALAEQNFKQKSQLSKESDRKILENMDQQVRLFQNFEKKHLVAFDSLKNILISCQEKIRNNLALSQDEFTQLENSILAYDKDFQEFFQGIFGEGGAFSEKIALSEEMDLLSDEIDSKREQLQKIRLISESLIKKEHSALSEVVSAETLFKASDREVQKLEKNISSLEIQHRQAHEKFSHIQSEMTSNNAKLQKIENLMENYELKLQEIRKESFDLQEELSNARVNYNSFETQVQALGSDIKNYEDRITEFHQQQNRSKSEQEFSQKQLAELSEEMEDLLEEQDELKPELSRLQDQLKQNFTDIADLRQAKKVIEQQHKDGVDKFTKLRMRESEIEGSLSERKSTLQNMKQNFEEQFHFSHETISVEKEESTEKLNAMIRSHRDRLNQMGNVNLLAIEQFHQTKETYASLTYQKEDIEAAAADTEMLINDTNKESADRFLIAFEQIRKSFRALFSELFNGGRADLILKDKNDPLNSGIDIMAEPPGQKFQNVSLLSGGQRAMVAIAVIFSILELKPTPFVILDEMDAPLDDENIDRYKRLLVRFKGTSQFIVVSHSKSTLEVCDVLFGVTMEELGCSKVVSVAFDDTENLLFSGYAQ